MKQIRPIIITVATAVVLLGILVGCTANVSYVYDNGEKYEAGDREISQKIDTINIDYMSGTLTLNGTNRETISIKETANQELDDAKKVHTWVDGSTLYVRYCASGRNYKFKNLKKKLEIDIPENVKLEKLKLVVSSGDVVAKNFQASSVEAEASSGDMNFECSANDINIEVSSGNAKLKQNGESSSIKTVASSGNLVLDLENASDLYTEVSSGNMELKAGRINKFKTVCSSGDGVFTFMEAPENMDVVTSSGDLTIYLPETSDISGNVVTSSGDFTYELPFSKDGKTYTCGKGTNSMSIHTSSGDVKIKKTPQ